LVLTHTVPQSVPVVHPDEVLQVPPEQVAPDAHAWPQLPQFEALVPRFASQPSPTNPLQSANPGLQAPMPHTPLEQATNAFARGGQA
jgi:hypothetical protein